MTLVALSALSYAESDPWYYYGGPGYYHGYYSSGFYQYPSHYYNSRKRRSPQQHVTRDDQIKTLGYNQANDLTYYVALLNPYRDSTHYGYPHYYAYGSPVHLNYIGKRRNRRQIGYAGYGRGRSTVSKTQTGPTVGNYYGPFGHYGAPWWAGYGRWGYYAKPSQVNSGNQIYSYSL